MHLTKLLYDFLIVAIAVATASVPRAFDVYLTLREQRSAEQAEE